MYSPPSRGPWRALSSRARVLTALSVVVLSGVFGLPVTAGSTHGPAHARARGRELAALRTATSTTFRKADGTLSTSISATPVNFRDGSGAWRRIESKLVPVAGGGFAFASRANAFKVRFKDAVGPAFVGVDLLRGRGFTFGLLGANPGAARVAGSAIHYADVQRGVDLDYDVLPQGLKESVVLANAQAPAAYRFTLTPAPGTALTAVKRADGSWSFRDRGRQAFVLQAPAAFESTPASLLGTTQQAVAAPHGTLHLDVSPQADGTFAVTLAVSRQWLSNPHRSFPVVLDPTFTLSPVTDGTFSGSSSSTGDFTSNQLTAAPGSESALRFDLSGVPTGTVTSATLNLYWNSCAPASADTARSPCPWNTGFTYNPTMVLKQLTVPWSATSIRSDVDAGVGATLASKQWSVCWNCSDPNPGVWKNWNVPNATVQGWLTGGQPNYGFVMQASAGNGGYVFSSSRGGSPPTFVVNVTPNVVTATTPPSISPGPPLQAGQTVTGSNGVWSGVGTISYAKQWQDCTSYGSTVLTDTPAGYWRLGDASGGDEGRRLERQQRRGQLRRRRHARPAGRARRRRRHGGPVRRLRRASSRFRTHPTSIPLRR